MASLIGFYALVLGACLSLVIVFISLKIELNKIEKAIAATDKKVENLLTRIDEIAKENEKLSQELDVKRKKITD